MKFNINNYKNIEGWCNFEDIYATMVDSHNNATFVEVGSWKGQSAALMAMLIANLNKNIKFYCVDTWDGSVEHAGETDVVNNTLFNTFMKNVEPYKDYLIPMRKASLEAAATFPDKSLDFVFIDAAHDYENVKNDINAWFPKVKNGGTIAGHDYDPTWAGVMKAVQEWSSVNRRRIQITGTSWVHFKNSSD